MKALSLAAALAAFLAAPLARGQDARPPADPSTSSSGTTPDAHAAAVPCGATDDVDIGPRAALLVEKRREKCHHIAPYQPTWLEKRILGYEKAEQPSFAEQNLFGLYPRVQTIDHRSEWGGGIRLWRPNIKGSHFDVHGGAFASLGGFQFYDVQAGVIPHPAKGFPLFASRADQAFEQANVTRTAEPSYMIYGAFTRRYSPQYDFFGVGPDSQEENHSDYLQRDSLYEGVAGYRLWHRLTFATRLGYYHVVLGAGKDEELPNVEDVFDPVTIPGFEERPPDFLRYGASATFDSRIFAKNPHAGAVLVADWQRYDQRGGGQASFNRYAADVRAFLRLGDAQRVLALRAYFSKDDPSAAGGRVPFYLLQFLGGSHTLRAFDSQRFRGEKLALLQAEYRWEASPAIELALFVDSGTVAARTDDDLGSFKTDGGIGLRFKSHQALLMRLDLAWGAEGTKFLLRFSPSF